MRIISIMPSDLDAPLVFYRKSSGKFVVASQSDVSNAKELLVLVPGTEVAIHSVRLPTRNEAEARRAAPFAIEDELAVPAEDVHIALGPKLRGEHHRELHVCSASIMDVWIDRIQRNRTLRGAKLVAETSIIPAGQFVVDLGDRIIVRNGSQKYAIDASLPGDVVQAVLPDAMSASKIIGGALASRVGVRADEALDPLQTLLSWASATDNLLDLRQGAHAPRSSSDMSWSAWRVPGALAATVCAAWMATIALENRALGQLTDHMNSASRSIYASMNPGAPVPRNLAQAVKSPSSAHRAIDFRTASALLYSGVSEIGGPGIQSLRFDEKGGAMRARISYEEFGDELKLKEHLEKAGISVRIGEMRQQGSRVSGEITLELAK